jgi:hypothetical protein
MTAIKDDLLLNGQDAALGPLMQTVSAKVCTYDINDFYWLERVLLQWKALSDDERAEYEQLAAQDRARYESECQVRILIADSFFSCYLQQSRDEEVLRAQEERRKQNAATETESRMRTTTVKIVTSQKCHVSNIWYNQMVKSDASTVKSEVPKRQRELSQREKEATALRRQVG